MTLEVAVPTAVNILFCSLCNKPFDKQSTLKRHGYYCRSRSAGNTTVRPRSCLACARGKVRCDNKVPGCSRCAVRAVRCHYPSNKDGSQPDKQQKTASVSSYRNSSTTGGLQPGSSNESFNIDDSFNTWDAELDTFGSEDLSWDVMGIDPTELLGTNEQYIYRPSTEPTASPAVTDCTSLNSATDEVHRRTVSFLSTTVSTMPNYTLRSFLQRPSTNGRASISASLIRRILSSYPMMMMTRQDSFPPFIHPHSLSLEQESTSIEPLTNCMSLLHMAGSRVPGSRKLFWKNVRLECERLCVEVNLLLSGKF